MSDPSSIREEVESMERWMVHCWSYLRTGRGNSSPFEETVKMRVGSHSVRHQSWQGMGTSSLKRGFTWFPSAGIELLAACWNGAGFDGLGATARRLFLSTGATGEGVEMGSSALDMEPKPCGP